jgi:transposase-like protein
MSHAVLITGVERRRKWTPERKLDVLREAFGPRGNVAEVTRREEISSGLLYRWRQALTRDHEPIDLRPKKWTGLCRSTLHVHWGEVAQSGVQAAGVIEAFDVGEQVSARFGAGGVHSMVYPFGLRVWKKLSIGALSQQSPLRLMEGVIPAAARAWRYASAETKLGAIARQVEACRRIMTIPGVGVITATALVSSIRDPHSSLTARLIKQR